MFNKDNTNFDNCTAIQLYILLGIYLFSELNTLFGRLSMI